ncbi:MAG: hypothetical protein H7A36_01590 [Chlamydiales bacterium]|nr:hypothetical protein [Chlamydiales bacterium]
MTLVGEALSGEYCAWERVSTCGREKSPHLVDLVTHIMKSSTQGSTCALDRNSNEIAEDLVRKKFGVLQALTAQLDERIEVVIAFRVHGAVFAFIGGRGTLLAATAIPVKGKELYSSLQFVKASVQEGECMLYHTEESLRVIYRDDGVLFNMEAEINSEEKFEKACQKWARGQFSTIEVPREMQIAHPLSDKIYSIH